MRALEHLQALTAQKHIWWVFAVWLLATATCVFAEESVRAFRYFERYFDHSRMMALGAPVFDETGRLLREWPNSEIVLVQLQDQAFESGGAFEQYKAPPLPRRLHAKLIQALQAAGAKVIGFDLVFETPSPDDAALAAEAKRHGKVVWGAVLGQSISGNPRLVQPVPAIKSSTFYLGHLQVPQPAEAPEVDTIQPLTHFEQQAVPAFSVQIARLATDSTAEISSRGNSVSVGNYSIPLDTAGRFPILYSGRKATSNPVASQVDEDSPFAVLPYEIALDAGTNPFFQQYFRDKIVIVGDVTQLSNDFRVTPAGNLAGMEIHGHAVATLLRGFKNPADFIRPVPLPVRIGLVALVAGLTAWICTYASFLSASLGVMVLGGAYFYLNYWCFERWRLDLPALAPLTSMLLCAAVITVQRGRIEERAKMEVRHHLNRYVSEEVADYVLQNADKYSLAGDRISATVMFCDIRDFTPLSERMQPQEVVALLNEYLTEMTAQVRGHGGTLDKYIGDAIMAFWGAPVRYEDHAWRAVSTAIEMEAALEELNAKWAERGLPRIEIGIGINSGDMIIGEMGAQARNGMPERVDFTAIGDAVNLASRVEGLNKTFDTRILITEATYRLVKYRVLVRGPYETHVKGRRESVSVYEVYGRRTSEGDEQTA